MKRKHLLFAVAILLSASFLPALLAEGRVFYVSSSGDDSSPGTKERPWKSLAKAGTNALPGDTVLLRGGEYHEKLTPANSGKPGLPITFKAFPGEEPIINGSMLPQEMWGGLIHADGREYLHFDGIQLKNASRFGIFVVHSSDIIIERCHSIDTQDSGIMTWDCSNIQIIGNEVERASLRGMGTGVNEGISVSNTDNFVIAGNHVHHGAMEGIDAKDGCQGGLIFGNLVHHQKAVGIYVDAWARHQFDIELFNNTCRDNGTSGIAVASEDGGLIERITVHDNSCYENDGPGFVLAGWNAPAEHPPGHPMKDIRIYRNLSWGNRVGFAIVCLEKTSLENAQFQNNIAFWNKSQGFWFSGEKGKESGIIVKNVEITNNTIVMNGLVDGWGAGGIQILGLAITNLLIRNNIVSNNRRFTIFLDSYVSPGEAQIDHNLIDGFRGLNEERIGTSFLKDSPQFIDAAKADFRLARSSPAIDQGSPEKAPHEDFSMLERPQGKGIDIGAYEFMPAR